MSVAELLCIACSVGWVVSIVSIVLLLFAGNYIAGNRRRTTTGVNAVLLVLILLVVAGFVGCGAEDRVCEIAGRS